MFDKRKAISGNFGWGCWSVNFPKFNKEENKAANASLKAMASSVCFHTVGKYYTQWACKSFLT